jgi:mono/diheme cytochrome c family protein
MVLKRWVVLLGAGLMVLVLGVLVGRALSADAAADEWTAPAEEAAKKNPVAADAASIAAGKGLYKKNCRSCHGETGKGDGEAALMFTSPPRDLSNPKIASQSDGSMYWKISEGRKPMAGFGKLLSETERWQVINYVRSLAPAAATTSSQPAKK